MSLTSAISTMFILLLSVCKNGIKIIYHFCRALMSLTSAGSTMFNLLLQVLLTVGRGRPAPWVLHSVQGDIEKNIVIIKL